MTGGAVPELTRGRRLLLDLGLLYAAAIWGSTFFIVKDALSGIHPFTLVSYRFLLSALFLAPWVVFRKEPARLLREGMALGTWLMLLYITQTAGLQFTTAANSGFLTGLFVLFVPLFLLVFFKRPPSAGEWVSVLAALAGLWLLTGGLGGFNRGDALTVVSAMAYAGHLLATDRFVRKDADPVLLAFHQFWFCGAASAVIAWAAGASFAVADPRTAWIVLFLTLFPNLSAFFIQIVAQKHTPALKVSLIFSLEPLFAALFAWTLGGEEFQPVKAAGGGLILAAMALGPLSRLSLSRGRAKEVLPS